MAACTGKGRRLGPLPLGLQTRASGTRNSATMSGEALRAWRAGSAFVVGINLLSRILEVAEGSVDSLISRGPAKPCAAEETLISRVTLGSARLFQLFFQKLREGGERKFFE